MFKLNWEKTSEIVIIKDEVLDKIFQKEFPNKKIEYRRLIKGGCANLNYSFKLVDNSITYLLRIYIRNNESLFIEQGIYQLVKEKIPVPKTYLTGEIDNYRYAIAEFLPGIELRYFLLVNNDYQIMHKIGLLLAKLSKVTFPKAGFFDSSMKISEFSETTDISKYINLYLEDEVVSSCFDLEMVSRIKSIIEEYSSLINQNKECNLVHGDFDPSNILVDNVDGVWDVTAVLDWEFAFSGSYLVDIANMLRYADELPKEYSINFIEGLEAGGVVMPEYWKIKVNLINLINLLDLLTRTDLVKCTNRYMDIKRLIESVVNKLMLNRV